ncbi:MAG TPA: hypothetical protein VK179_03915 [Bacteroidales bacterium]|nr:hypothetical protein [Bacteroidales bacterium]
MNFLNRLIKRGLFVLLFVFNILHSNFTFAQQPLTISLFNESTSIPYTTFFNSPVHPGIQAGTEFQWKQGQHFALYPTVNVGYMFHKNLFQGLYMNIELAFDVKTNFGLNFKSRLGLGYLRTFNTQQEYGFTGNGYKPSSDKGNSRLMPSFTLGLGYNLKTSDLSSPEVFVLYKSWIEYPYSPGFIPLMSHSDVHLGVKLYPFKNP